MELLIYILCALASLVCAVLLWRGHRQSGARLLRWSALCFLGLFLNNLLLIVDTHLVATVDLALYRMLPALAGALILVYGLIWDTE
ncbi:MAG TPA: DUF5985 family protein [Gemmatimonadaceae bacterium]|nr:DUF5985 family protein [Gemmatimonadaceae bacterium]